MMQRIQVHIATISVTCFLWSIFLAAPLRAEGTIEKAGVVTGVTVGNMWFIPLKAISVSWGAISGALSFVLMGGDTEVTRQIWRDTLQGPYVITPDLARKAIGERPELDIK